MIKQPPYLKKNDKIAIVCPAKKLKKSIEPAIALLEEWGLKVIRGKTIEAGYHQFAGDDALRAADLQVFLDDPEIKAIIAGRGGYGTIRIIDLLDFTEFNKNPKWIVGFSDITVLLSHITGALQTQSIHGQMPSTFEDATPASLEALKNALFGEEITYTIPVHPLNRKGEAEGILVGGNLSILIAMEGSPSEMDYTDKILFLEDVGEYEYSIDRMLRLLKRSGKLSRLKGLIIGAFNEIKTEDIPFGQTAEQIIKEIVKEYAYPTCFNFPVGHITDNRAMILGKQVTLCVNDRFVKLIQEQKSTQ
ncbi:S66 peptidase family protein [Pedobacter sp. AW31-3R]|uniref:S66 peptidase family protein n=1 Tax=Pedobacter sp. AW31-3R TaxID=3445781 RepID=UPI003F9F423C